MRTLHCGTSRAAKSVRLGTSVRQYKTSITCGWCSFCIGGEREIRTLGTGLPHTRFPVVRLRPAQPSLHADSNIIPQLLWFVKCFFAFFVKKFLLFFWFFFLVATNAIIGLLLPSLFSPFFYFFSFFSAFRNILLCFFSSSVEQKALAPQVFFKIIYTKNNFHGIMYGIESSFTRNNIPHQSKRG